MQNYVIYVVALALLIFMFYRKFSLTINKNINNVSAADAYQLIKSNKDLVVIDVRTKQEFKSGHITGSKSFPVNELSSRVSELMKYKEKPILVHCASGNRSSSAVRILLRNGFSNIYHMKNGLRGWNYGLK